MPEGALSHADFLRDLGAHALRFELDSNGAATTFDHSQRIGPYELIEEIARGGMGVVYTARQIGLARIVALKLIAGGKLATAEAEMRFEREAQTAARLHHPNIVAIHDYGRAAGHAYFSMDYFPEGDLAHRMTGQAFAQREAAELLEKIAVGMAYAHREGVLHRDLKPSNILINGAEALIADFGLSALIEAGCDLTAVTRVLGTPHYLAPEGFAGGSGAMSVTSDVYALGAILYEMLTGRPPFGGAGASQLPALIATCEPVTPRRINPAVDRDLETICLKCLEKDPARRYASAELLADDLRHFLAHEPIVARPVSPPVRFLRWGRRHPALASAWLLVFALAVVSSLAAVVIQKGRNQIQLHWVRARQAEQTAKDRLWDAQLAHALALEHTGRIGQRFDALDALAEAAKIRVTPELRDAAIDTLTQTDLRKRREWTACASTNDQMAFSPDLASYVVAKQSGLVEQRDISTDQIISSFDTAEVGKLVVVPIFSQDGKRLLLRGSDHSVGVWNLATGKMICRKADCPIPDWAKAELATDLSWAPAGTEFCVASNGGGLDFCDAKDGRVTRHWASSLRPFSTRYSPDGRLLALADPGQKKVILLDLASLEIRWTLDVPAAACNLAWQPDGAQIALAGQDADIRLVDAASGRIVREIKGHRARVFQVLYSPDGRLLLSNGGDSTIRLWDARTGASLLVMTGVGGCMNTTFAPDGLRLAVMKLDTDGLLLDLASPEFINIVPVQTNETRGALVGALDFSRDGQWLAIASWSGAKIVDGITGRLLANFPSVGEKMDETSAHFAPDQSAIYLCSRERGLRRYPLATPDGGRTIIPGSAQILDSEPSYLLTSVNADGSSLALTSLDRNELKILAPDGSLQKRLPGQHAIWTTAFSPDGRWLATQAAGDDDPPQPGVTLWSTVDWNSAHNFPTGSVGLLAFSGNGRWLAAAGTRQFMLIDTTTWQPTSSHLPEAVSKAGAVSSFSKDGQLLAVTVDDATYLIRPATGERLARLVSPSGDVSTARVCLNPDGTRIAIMRDDGKTELWDLAQLRRSLATLGLDWKN